MRRRAWRQYCKEETPYCLLVANAHHPSQTLPLWPALEGLLDRPSPTTRAAGGLLAFIVRSPPPPSSPPPQQRNDLQAWPGPLVAIASENLVVRF